MNLLSSDLLASAALIANDRDWEGPPWPWFPIVPIVVLALLWFGFWRYRWRSGRASGESVLAERYARGEIDEAEYRSRRAVLRSRR